MTIENLLALPVNDLADISDADLQQWLAPYFPLTRPRKIPVGTTTTSTVDESNFAPEVQAVLAAARAAKPKNTINLAAMLAPK